MQYPKPIMKLIESFSKLPGIGHKTAERLAFYVISDMKDDDATRFARALVDVKRELFECEKCALITDSNLCSICADDKRDESMIAVVESSKDVLSLEKMQSFRGRYHVLGGVLSPLDGVGPEDIGIAPLIERLGSEEVEEIILALGATLEGDATSQYLAKLLKDTGIRITRIARGLEMGRSIDYADEVTLIRALEGRLEL
jgi:recombination protein RecR